MSDSESPVTLSPHDGESEAVIYPPLQAEDSPEVEELPQVGSVPSPSPQYSVWAVLSAGQQFGLKTRVIGTAIAIGTLPLLFLGIVAYFLTHSEWSAITGATSSVSYQQIGVLVFCTTGTTALIVGVLTAYWLHQSIQPVLDIAHVVEDLCNGDLDVQAPVQGTDEVAVLGTSINQMASQIRDLQEERERQTQALQAMNGALEGRVQQRTAQLSGVINQLKQEIWERKQAEIALQKSQIQLIQSEKMSGLGQMIAGLAHEINNPVNFVHGNLKHLQNHVQEILSVLETYQMLYPEAAPEVEAIAKEVDLDFISKDVRKVVASMRVGVDRILDIVRSLRTFSRVDQVEFKQTDIHAGIESTLLILKHRLKPRPGRPQILVVRKYDDLPLVECHSGQINQVFMNILANALDALDESGDLCFQKSEPPMLIIATQVLEGNRIAIQISDNGPGIPSEVQHRLFDPFFTTKPVGQGTGLGMSISHTIITETHKGSLRLISTSGQGASFLIELPVTHHC